MDMEKYRTPTNGLILVTFVKPWNAYRAGQVAGFADAQAMQLRDAGIAQLREYKEPEPQRPGPSTAGFLGPVRAPASADNMNTTNVRRAGEQGPAPEDPGRRIARTSGAGGPQGLGDFPETAGMGSAAQTGDGDFSRSNIAQGEGGGDDERDAVEIPDDWEDLHFQRKVKIARDLGAEDASTKDEAEAVIRQELERRNAG